MPVKILLEKPLDPMETYRLAETTDLFYRKLRNVGYARRHAEYLLTDEHTALEAAAAKIVKRTPSGEHPVTFINKGNLAVLRIVSMSVKRAMCLGTEGRFYAATRGHLFPDGKFIPTAETLSHSFMLFSTKRDKMLTRLAILRPTKEYVS